jgi:hypothetical protein
VILQYQNIYCKNLCKCELAQDRTIGSIFDGSDECFGAIAAGNFLTG